MGIFLIKIIINRKIENKSSTKKIGSSKEKTLFVTKC